MEAKDTVMSKDQIEEAMLQYIKGYHPAYTYTDISLIKELLDLRYPKCKECSGTGRRFLIDERSPTTCPICKGSGKGMKMLAILSEDQTLPKIMDIASPKDAKGKTKNQWFVDGQVMALELAYQAGWRKTVE